VFVQPDECLDWIFATPQARPLLASVIRPSLHHTSVPPSDHCPVLAMYQLQLYTHHTPTHTADARDLTQDGQQHAKAATASADD
jgi:hypothetical protein